MYPCSSCLLPYIRYCTYTVAIDILVWTNDNVMNWVNSIGMNEYAINLVNSGVHGGLIALDNTFDYERLAMALQIPTSDTTVRECYYTVCIIPSCTCIVS